MRQFPDADSTETEFAENSARSAAHVTARVGTNAEFRSALLLHDKTGFSQFFLRRNRGFSAAGNVILRRQFQIYTSTKKMNYHLLADGKLDCLLLFPALLVSRNYLLRHVRWNFLIMRRVHFKHTSTPGYRT